MGLGSLLSNNQQVVSILQGTNVLIQFDASIKEQHSRESPPTEFEIENGQVISDHVIVRPFHLQLEVLVVDNPINAALGLLTAGIAGALPNAAVLGAYAPAVSLVSGLIPGADPNQRRSAQVYDQLLALQNSRLPFNVFTSLKLYKNMWIKNVGSPRTPTTGRQAIIELDFSQLLLVTPQTTVLSALQDSALSAGQGNNGSQQGVNYIPAGISDTLNGTFGQNAPTK